MGITYTLLEELFEECEICVKFLEENLAQKKLLSDSSFEFRCDFIFSKIEG